MFFDNRIQAGQRLCEKLSLDDFGHGRKVILFAIVRGGVIVAQPIAKKLRVPIIPLWVEEADSSDEKISVLTNLGSGTCISKEGRVFVPKPNLNCAPWHELSRAIRNEQTKYGSSEETTNIRSKEVIICDDGFVTGRTAFAAIDTMKNLGAKSVTLAIPIIPQWLSESHPDFEILTWRVTTMQGSPPTGIFYKSFRQVTRKDVIETIARSHLQD